MNPSKMRDSYGKMMFILQDTETHIVKSETGLSFLKDILTVTSFLHEKNSLELLEDPLLDEATCSINNIEGEKSREELQQLGQQKQDAINQLVQHYSSGRFLPPLLPFLSNPLIDLINEFLFRFTNPCRHSSCLGFDF